MRSSPHSQVRGCPWWKATRWIKSFVIFFMVCVRFRGLQVTNGLHWNILTVTEQMNKKREKNCKRSVCRMSTFFTVIRALPSFFCAQQNVTDNGMCLRSVFTYFLLLVHKVLIRQLKQNVKRTHTHTERHKHKRKLRRPEKKHLITKRILKIFFLSLFLIFASKEKKIERK